MLTLCIIHQPPRVLLGFKKRGFGQGRWNGFGGKVKAGESIEQAARREVQEEAGLTVEAMERVGILEFRSAGDPAPLEVHVFYVRQFSGEPKETTEMRPRWFPVAALPYAQMWPDDQHWLPLLLAGKKFRGSFTFDERETLLSVEIHEMSTW